MYLAQGRIHLTRAAPKGLYYMKNPHFSNVKTLEGFLDRYRAIKLGESSNEITYNQFQTEITSACPNWDFSTVTSSQTQSLINLLRTYKAHNVPVLFSLQKQFVKSLPTQNSLSFSEALAIVQFFTPENIADTTFLTKSYEFLIEKYQKDPQKSERKIGNFAWYYAYFNLIEPKFTDFFTNELQTLIPITDITKNRVEAIYLARIASYLSFEYKNSQNLHEKLFSRLEQQIEHDRVSFYRSMNDPDHLRLLWTWFHSVELYDKDLYLSYKEKVCKKIPFQFRNRVNYQARQQRQEEFGDFLRKNFEKTKVKQEQLLGIYQVDFLVEGSNVVIEYNGKTHYVNFSERETGKHWTRARNIRDSGYKLVDIAYYEWNGLTTPQQKQEYLKKKFKEANAEI